MRISIKVKYGLQAVLELALKYTGGTIQIGEIAKKQRIPVRYLEQLLLILKRAGLVRSSRGKKGGYSLAKHPSDISVLEVFETFEGEIDLCFCRKDIRRTSPVCEVFEQIESDMRNRLKSISIEDLVFRQKQKQRAISYEI